jgi:hypothetical protein
MIVYECPEVGDRVLAMFDKGVFDYPFHPYGLGDAYGVCYYTEAQVKMSKPLQKLVKAGKLVRRERP